MFVEKLTLEQPKRNHPSCLQEQIQHLMRKGKVHERLLDSVTCRVCLFM